MNRLIAFARSSIGKKISMSLTGLFLCSFLIEHLVGNLLLLSGDGGMAYDSYTAFMVGNPVVRAIEVVLFLSLAWHAATGLVIWRQNRASRPVTYGEYRIRETAPLWSRITLLTGSIVFIFLVVHLRTFFVPMRFSDSHPSGYFLVQEAFANGAYTFFYVIAMILLSYHLRHGFQAAMQTLGLRNTKYRGLVDVVGLVFWLLIPLGFAVLPLYFYFFQNPAGSTMASGGILP